MSNTLGRFLDFNLEGRDPTSDADAYIDSMCMLFLNVLDDGEFEIVTYSSEPLFQLDFVCIGAGFSSRTEDNNLDPASDQYTSCITVGKLHNNGSLLVRVNRQNVATVSWEMFDGEFVLSDMYQESKAILREVDPGYFEWKIIPFGESTYDALLVENEKIQELFRELTDAKTDSKKTIVRSQLKDLFMSFEKTQLAMEEGVSPEEAENRARAFIKRGEKFFAEHNKQEHSLFRRSESDNFVDILRAEPRKLKFLTEEFDLDESDDMDEEFAQLFTATLDEYLSASSDQEREARVDDLVELLSSRDSAKGIDVETVRKHALECIHKAIAELEEDDDSEDDL